jgi:hypothetical protein
MNVAALRKPIFAIPFGCLAAIATHFVRFGDEHAFGGSANEALVSGAVAGSIAIAIAILTVFLSAGSTFMSGSVAATRIRALVPGAPAIFAIAAFVYYGIESLEGHGIEIGLPTIVLAIFATVLAYALRACAKAIARIVITVIRDGFARLARRERPVLRFALEPQRIHSQTARAARRLGRAPPNERRLL